MSEEEKVKTLFPDDIETITISKNDYDRLYGEMTLENIELKEKTERLNNRLKTSNDTCNYLRNTIDKAIEWIEENQYYFPRPDELLKILKGSDKE